MSFTGFSVVMPVPAVEVDKLAPVLGPLIELQATSGSGQGVLERWLRGGSEAVDVLDLHDSTAPYLLDDHLDLLHEVWGAYEKAGPFLKAPCRRGHPGVWLAHGLGPQPFGALPGWFGPVRSPRRSG